MHANTGGQLRNSGRSVIACIPFANNKQPAAGNSGVRVIAGHTFVQGLLDAREQLFGELLRILVEFQHFRAQVRQLAPATDPGEFLPALVIAP